MNTARRSFLFGLSAFLAAPAIVRVASLMPVSVPKIIAPPPLVVPPYGNYLVTNYGATVVWLGGLDGLAVMPGTSMYLCTQEPLLAPGQAGLKTENMVIQAATDMASPVFG